MEGEVFREGNGNGDVARRGDLPRSVLDSSGRRDLDLPTLDELRDLLRPLETSWSGARCPASRKMSPVSLRSDILILLSVVSRCEWGVVVLEMKVEMLWSCACLLVMDDARWEQLSQ